MGCAITIVKYLLFIFNFVLAIAGLGLLIAGVLIEIQVSDVGEFLDGKFQAPAILLIVVGSIVFFVAFFGCCGAWKESYCYIVMYIIMLVTIFIVQVVAAGLAFAYRDDVRDALDEKLSNAVGNYYNSATDRESIDNIQNRLDCCGYDGPLDYITLLNPLLPSSCCKGGDTCTIVPADSHHEKGCKEALRDFIDRNGNIIGGVAIGVCVIELIGVIFSICLANSIKSKSKRGV